MLQRILSSNNSHYKILMWGALLSLIISWLYIRGTHVISPDSLLYIFSAQTLISEGIVPAIEVYHWPLLSTLIATIHKITGLPLTTSGHILISLIYAGITCTFISLVRDLGGSAKLQLLALLVISIFPTLNDYRHYITRDAGFWLFSLLAIQQILRFAIKNSFKNALGWFSFTVIAIGFRTEAIFFAALSPLAVFIDTHTHLRQRFKKTAILYGLFASIAAGGLLLVFLSPQLTAKFRLVTEIANLNAFFLATSQQLENTIELFASQTPYKFAADDMGTIFVSGLFGLVLYSLLHSLTLAYAILFLLPQRQQFFSNPRFKTYLLVYLSIITIYLLLLSFRKYYMADRFCVLANLIIMLVLPFCIDKAWTKAPSKPGWKRGFILLLLAYPALDSMISSGNSKEYIAIATEWIKQNKPPEKTLLTNHKQIAILGANCLTECFIKKDPALLIEKAKAEKPDLLAIHIKDKPLELLKETNLLIESSHWTLTQTVKGEDSDQILILSHQLQSNAK